MHDAGNLQGRLCHRVPAVHINTGPSERHAEPRHEADSDRSRLGKKRDGPRLAEATALPPTAILSRLKLTRVIAVGESGSDRRREA